VPQLSARLTAEERREKHRIFLSDTATLAMLTAVVIVLSFVTYALYHSFSGHRQMLEARWRVRGENALAAGQPNAALNDLHSALAYAPDDRGLQIELATALAAAGHTQEAKVYFGTLLETEPGSGAINLQLARLAIRQNDTQAAVDHYEAAIDGTWNGDAFMRRREIRLELAQFLIAKQRIAEARNLLLITAGNAPENHPLQIEVAGLLIETGDAQDALEVYRKAATAHATRLPALEGEGAAAIDLGLYAMAHQYLAQAEAEPAFAHQPHAIRNTVHASLDTANSVLALFPSDNLTPRERAQRIAHAAALAQARLLACPANTDAAPPASSQALAATSAQAQQRAALLGTLTARLKKLNPLAAPNSPAPAADLAAATAPATPGDPLSALAARWAPIATGAALGRQLLADPVFAQNTLNLVYDTERTTAGLCGAPTGDDALLLKIAQAPGQVMSLAEVQP
jgi:Tfp pilus assembly protein PilF